MEPEAVRTIALALVAALLLVVFKRRRRRKRASRERRRQRFHRRTRAAADRSLDKVRGFEKPAQVIAYLRKIDHFAFEELLLSAFAARGSRVLRNRRYTGDGGFDGEIRLNAQPVMVQAKRYSQAIDPAHVEAFSQACLSNGARGLFIHTGRTGPLSRVRVREAGHIEIVSGDRLVALIRGAPLTLFGETV